MPASQWQGFDSNSLCLAALYTSRWADVSFKKVSGSSNQSKAARAAISPRAQRRGGPAQQAWLWPRRGLGLLCMPAHSPED